jgi:vacuolar-type H+-ATPase subunit H
MTDKAHKLTDKKIAEIEKKLTDLYSKSYGEIKKKSADILNKIETKTDMTAEQRYNEYLKYNRLQALEQQVSEVLKDTNKEAVKIINSSMPDVYKLNYDEMIKVFPEGTIFPVINKSAVKTVLNEQVAPFKMLKLNDMQNIDLIRRDLTSSLTSGILQGESIPSLAKRIKAVTNKNLSSFVTIARTETTRIESSARQDVGEQGVKLGFKMKKQWVSTADDRSRDEHLQADGQIVDIDKPFRVGGEDLMYPGDESGSAGNTINCRCTMVNIVDDGEVPKSDRNEEVTDEIKRRLKA